MRTALSFAAGVSVALAAALPPQINAIQERQTVPAANCTDLYILVARGSYEAPGEGMLGEVASSICSQVSSCSSMGIAYPAIMGNGGIYVGSESAGVAAMTSDASAYHASCPNSAIVLMGYSQGAQVVGDSLCGTNDEGWTATPAMSGSLAQHIVAAIQLGDPSFVAGKSYDVGTATQDGVVHHKNTSYCEPFANIIQSYCNAGDPYCANGDNITVHHSYRPIYGPAAASFVVSKFNAFASPSSSPASTSISGPTTMAAPPTTTQTTLSTLYVTPTTTVVTTTPPPAPPSTVVTTITTTQVYVTTLLYPLSSTSISSAKGAKATKSRG